MERAFSVRLHTYEVAPHDNIPGYTYHAPLGRPTIPTESSGAVIAVVGLDNSPVAHPHLSSVSGLKHARFPMVEQKTSGNPFGYLTVTDFAKDYDVNLFIRRASPAAAAPSASSPWRRSRRATLTRIGRPSACGEGYLRLLRQLLLAGAGSRSPEQCARLDREMRRRNQGLAESRFGVSIK
jgi:hypothetical protein